MCVSVSDMSGVILVGLSIIVLLLVSVGVSFCVLDVIGEFYGVIVVIMLIGLYMFIVR